MAAREGSRFNGAHYLDANGFSLSPVLPMADKLRKLLFALETAENID
ncbi:MAG: hypothetical protein ACKV2U_09830 [Bryobacteraceae bacterium]